MAAVRVVAPIMMITKPAAAKGVRLGLNRNPGSQSVRASNREDGARGARLHSGLRRLRPTTGGGRE